MRDAGAMAHELGAAEGSASEEQIDRAGMLGSTMQGCPYAQPLPGAHGVAHARPPDAPAHTFVSHCSSIAQGAPSAPGLGNGSSHWPASLAHTIGAGQPAARLQSREQ